MKAFRVRDPLYDMECDFYIGGTKEQVIQYIDRTYPSIKGQITENLLLGTGKFFSAQFDDGLEFNFIWIKDPKRLDMLVHEIFHLVAFTLTKVGVMLNQSSGNPSILNDEPFAYLLGFYVREVFRKLKLL